MHKKVETIVDFESEINTIYQISEDRQYIKKAGEEDSIYERRAGRYCQYRYEKINERVEREWKKMIAEMKPNREVKIYGRTWY